ncbi:MAG: helix-turn-helix domain-containing protein, partial [Thermoplasmatales archaeon]|nr:helix-turn-helix domain-containing protein [Thermoplasmatales archaeon]
MKVGLNSLQIKIMRELSSADYEILKELAHAVGRSQTRISIALEDLEKLGFIITEKKGLSKRASLSSNKHAVLLKRLFTKYYNIKFEKYISGSVIDVLGTLAHSKCILSEITEQSNCSERTVMRVVKLLSGIGIIVRENKHYMINQQFNILSEFIREFQAYINLGLAYEFSKTATILWQKGKEFLIETREEHEKEHFFLTGCEKLGDFGIPLIVTDVNHYFYT